MKECIMATIAAKGKEKKKKNRSIQKKLHRSDPITARTVKKVTISNAVKKGN